jgi:hypothetical protein
MANTVYEMMVSSIIGSPNIILIVEKLPLNNMTEEQYVEALKTQVTEPIAAMGFDMVFSASSTVSVAGKTFTMIPAEIPGIANQDYYIKRYDNRMAVLIVSYSEDTIGEAETLLGAFRAI